MGKIRHCEFRTRTEAISYNNDLAEIAAAYRPRNDEVEVPYEETPWGAIVYILESHAKTGHC